MNEQGLSSLAETTDKAAMRIVIRQLSDAELEREEKLMRKISQRTQGIADACARERKQRKRRILHPK